MLKIRCKSCNTELESHPSKTRSCGCSNITTIRDEVISAIDLSLVEITQRGISKKSQNEYNYLTKEDIEWQESRKNRKVRRLEFEIR
jgi:hypothetical protein